MFNFILAASALAGATLVSAGPNGPAHRGLAWATNDNYAPLLGQDQVSWYYHYQDGAVKPMPSDVEFVPMFWGDPKTDLFNKIEKTFGNGFPKAILGFNEPDQGGQANMSPQRAADVWRQRLQKYASQGIKLGAPAVVGNRQWLVDFFNACNDCTIDFLPLHWYGAYTDFNGFKNWVTSIHNIRPNINIWITEYGFTASAGGSKTDIDHAIVQFTDWIDQQPWISRASFFGVFEYSNNPDGYTNVAESFLVTGGQSLRFPGRFWVHNDRNFPSYSKRDLARAGVEA